MTNPTAQTSNVTSLRKLQPGDILDVTRTLRKLLVQCESSAFTLYADFTEIGSPELEKEAERARHTLELATSRVATVIDFLEKSQHYQECTQRKS